MSLKMADASSSSSSSNELTDDAVLIAMVDGPIGDGQTDGGSEGVDVLIVGEPVQLMCEALDGLAWPFEMLGCADRITCGRQ